MTDVNDQMAERKDFVALAGDQSAYEKTEFGRRKISKSPRWFASLIQMLSVPALFIYRRLRRAKSA